MTFTRKIRIKNILQVGGWKLNNMNALSMSKVCSNEEKRLAFVRRIRDIMVQNQLDGVLIFWAFPNCPDNSAICTNLKLDDRLNVVSLLRELSQLLKPIGKLVLFYSSINSVFLTFSAGDVYSPSASFVDYYVLETFKQAGHWSKTIDLSTNLKKMRDNFDLFRRKVDRAVLRKVLIFFDIGSLTFELKIPNAHRIGSGFIQESQILPEYSPFTDVKF
ncbi:chitinase-3-like protein 1 [Neocloeon triangulifer]|uniref:chitinase-3-like protein 1 n=1 Tax=Neocloeon triangulifer TaxID=2078957 RepID=UPI00286EF685|nr:chitinase-3-like protein 1 [Neocloeon triangulifer]